MSGERHVRRTAAPILLVVAILVPGGSLAQSTPASGAPPAGAAEAAPKDPFAYARKLLEAGYADEAREEARKVAKAKTADIPVELHAQPVAWADQLGAVWSVVFEALKGLAAIAAAFVVGTALRRAIWPVRIVPQGWLDRVWPWLARQRRRVLAVRRRARPFYIAEVTEPDPEQKVATDVRQSILSEIVHVGSPASNLMRVSEPNLQLPDAELLPSQAKAVASLVSFLRPRGYTVNCILRPPIGDQVRLYLSIEGTGGRTLLRKHFDGKIVGRDRSAGGAAVRSAYLDASVQASTWLVFEMLRLRHRPRDDQTTKAYESDLWRLGTREWQSYAHFRRGQIALEHADVGSARALFVEAIAVDPRNVSALVELGRLDLLPPDGLLHLDRAMRRLTLAERLLEQSGRPLHDVRANPLWFTAKFQLCVAHLHRFAHNEALDPAASSRAPAQAVREDLDRGLELARELTRAIGEDLSSLCRDGRGEQRDRYDRTRLRQRNARLLAGVLAGAKASAEWLDRRTILPPDLERRPPAGPNELWGWMAALESTKALPSAQTLILALGDETQSRIGLYNRACFYARTRAFGRCLRALAEFVELTPPKSYAYQAAFMRTDPTLRPLAQSEKWGHLFHSLIEQMEAGARSTETPGTPAGFARPDWRVECPAPSSSLPTSPTPGPGTAGGGGAPS